MDIRDIREKRKEVEALQDRIAWLRSKAEYGERLMRNAPGGSFPDDKLSAAVSALVDMEKESVVKETNLEASIMAVEQQLELLPEQQQVIMRLRYIRGLSWRRVADEAHYHERYCRKIHAKAMKNWAEKGRF